MQAIIGSGFHSLYPVHQLPFLFQQNQRTVCVRSQQVGQHGHKGRLQNEKSCFYVSCLAGASQNELGPAVHCKFRQQISIVISIYDNLMTIKSLLCTLLVQ